LTPTLKCRAGREASRLGGGKGPVETHLGSALNIHRALRKRAQT